MIISDPYFYLIAIPVVLLTGLSKTGIPGLFGGMAVPFLSLVISPLQAAAVMLPVLCFIDLFGLRAFWGVYDRPNMPILIVGLVAGVVVGTLIFGLVRQDVLRLAIGGIAIHPDPVNPADVEAYSFIALWAVSVVHNKLRP